jgi:hypothetical protein
VNRLKAYKSNLVVFPRHRNSKKPKVGGKHGAHCSLSVCHIYIKEDRYINTYDYKRVIWDDKRE